MDDDAILSDGWVRSAVYIPMAPLLSGQAGVKFIKGKWAEMLCEQRLDPKYSISAPYWHAVVDKEYGALLGGR